MKILTRDTDYAIRALCFIAGQEKKVVAVAEMVEQLKIPRPFLRKILQMLNHEGVVQSYKGSAGGFSMAVSPEKVTLMNVINIFQGAFEEEKCLFKKRRCPNRSHCRLRAKLNLIEDGAKRVLNSTSILSLIRKESHDGNQN